MLTKKQIDSLPKGHYSNIDLSRKFKHGKKNRVKVFPVDKYGFIVTDPTKKEVVATAPMLLNRQQFKKFNGK